MKQYANAALTGHLNMKTISKESGELLDEFDDDNVIILQGFSDLLDRITIQDGSTDETIIETIYLGSDVGTGDLLSPEPANATLTGADQSVVYQIPKEDITLNYESSKTISLVTVLDGTQILDALFPTSVDLRYTSATVRYKSGRTFSYKRFPVRSLSRLVDIQITWTISFEEKGA